MDYKRMSDSDLENAWQNCASQIKMACQYYFKTEDESMRLKIEEIQSKQSEIQKEITRRH